MQCIFTSTNWSWNSSISHCGCSITLWIMVSTFVNSYCHLWATMLLKPCHCWLRKVLVLDFEICPFVCGAKVEPTHVSAILDLIEHNWSHVYYLLNYTLVEFPELQRWLSGHGRKGSGAHISEILHIWDTGLKLMDFVIICVQKLISD